MGGREREREREGGGGGDKKRKKKIDPIVSFYTPMHTPKGPYSHSVDL